MIGIEYILPSEGIKLYEEFYKKYGNEYIEDPGMVRSLMHDSDVQFWGNEDMIGLTSIEKCGIEKFMLIRSVMGKNIKDWIRPALRTIEKYAKSMGCDKVKSLSRPGVLRFFKGYKTKQILLEREI